MRYIEAFSTVHENEYVKTSKDRRPSLFLAGGITGCPPWQDIVVEALRDTNLIIINPRRAVWPGDDNLEEIRKQITWERGHLWQARAILFWFCKETDCPITLFELGRYTGEGKRMFVGCEPGYRRAFDVEVQLGGERPEINVKNNLNSLVAEVKEWYDGWL